MGEGEVCLYQKYGFCKYKENCKKRHLEDECTNLNNCRSKNTCEKRHPKMCRRYVWEGSCRYGNKCEYIHKEKEKSMEEGKLNKRIDDLEKIVEKKSLEQKKMEMAVRELEKGVKAMSRKVIHLFRRYCDDQG